MARQMAMTPLVNPTLGELTIYTVITTLAFSTVSLVLTLILTTCHSSCLVTRNLV